METWGHEEERAGPRRQSRATRGLRWFPRFVPQVPTFSRWVVQSGRPSEPSPGLRLLVAPGRHHPGAFAQAGSQELLPPRTGPYLPGPGAPCSRQLRAPSGGPLPRTHDWSPVRNMTPCMHPPRRAPSGKRAAAGSQGVGLGAWEAGLRPGAWGLLALIHLGLLHSPGCGRGSLPKTVPALHAGAHY